MPKNHFAFSGQRQRHNDRHDPNGDYWTWQESKRAEKSWRFLSTASDEVKIQALAILDATATAKDRHAAWAAVGRLIGRKL